MSLVETSPCIDRFPEFLQDFVINVHPNLLAGWLLLGVASLGGVWVRAAEPPTPSSIEQQLQELREGQARILKELEAIKAALAEPVPEPKPETPARPPLPPTVNVHGEPFLGSPGATVAILEYSDFDCDHCARFAAETFPELKAKYVETGKVKFFFRDLPEPGNAQSLLKARVARCAGEQGQFWPMQEYLFLQRPSLTEPNSLEALKLPGLDRVKLQACLSQPQAADVVQRSAASANRLGVHGTPTFIIGLLTDEGDIIRVKEMLLGAESFATFQGILDPLLPPPAK